MAFISLEIAHWAVNPGPLCVCVLTTLIIHEPGVYNVVTFGARFAFEGSKWRLKPGRKTANFSLMKDNELSPDTSLSAQKPPYYDL